MTPQSPPELLVGGTDCFVPLLTLIFRPLSAGCSWQGYGDHKPKSSTAAQEVKTLDGIYTEQVRRGPPL